MIEVGESTGALADYADQRGGVLRGRCVHSVTAALSLIEPVIMIFMGIFVALS